ncbi:WhiB family transcriptional regulator [Bifidobacterium tissieri]|uniref:WhiB family transcriptional regulator n=1 Tax=Bifidobacterium tissieri TaxID=1630162 RepID=UPI00123966CC|nr:WhiB family transcriptional regulator [Bifidobacterium tissieri]KAA8831828.1 WhiB family transcriptional regulator [Bifidobacterium tissieri]
MNWMRHAACRDAPPDLFFPTQQNRTRARHALAVCASCPVIDQCRAYMQHMSRQSGYPLVGVWAGIWLDDPDRPRQYRRRRTR